MVIGSFISFLIYLFALGAVFGIVYWGVTALPIPEPVKKIILVFITVIGALIAISLLLSFMGIVKL